jgi:iron complex transport system substrate-binding protein
VPTRPRRKITLAVLLAAALAIAACGDDEPTESGDTTPADDAADEAAFPVTVEASNGSVTIAEQPERIVSMSPTATEMVFAIGAGDQVEAVDGESDFPEEVPTTDLSAYEFNAEAVAGYEPDLVLIADDAGDNVKALDALSIPVLNLTAAQTIDDIYTQLDVLGDATGHPDEADEVIDGMKADIDELTSDLPEGDRLTYYHELDDTLYSVTSDTFIGQVYALAKLENIADAVGGDSGGYPQLSAEHIVQSDPDLIFLADVECCQQSAETLAKRAGFADLTAIKEGNVVELDDDIASRWGPRVVELLQTIVDAVDAASAE